MSDERTLLNSAQSGDRAAFDRLQESMEPKLRRFVASLIGRQPSVDEVVQDTFLALYLKLERMESVEHVWPFVFRVARNLCYDELRRLHRYDFVAVNHGSEATDSYAYLPVDTLPPPDDDAEMLLIVAGVRRAMLGLPEQQRQALILYAEMDLPYAQVAEAMGIGIGTVKAHIHAGRKRLRTLVAPEILRSLGFHTKETTDGDR